ncbi:MAG: hypothetical protein IJS31_06440 [Oscillospiraceae bacterium]|nr:hypothetical protein [Oscillospiraceae bacterium]
MTKRILSLLLCLSMLLALSVGAFAANAPQLTVAGETAEAGEQATVSLNLSGNTGIAGMRLSVAYDSALTLDSIAGGEALASLELTQPGKLTANPINLFWDGLESDTSNGTVAVLTFTISETAQPGDYPVTVSYVAGEVYDGSLNDVALDVVNGSVTVPAPHVHSYTASVTTAATCETAGVMTYTCSCGDSYTEPIAALGHDWDEGVVTKQPTKTEQGEMTYTCKRDATHTKTEPIATLPLEPALTVTGGTAKPGEDVTVTLSLEENPGILGARFSVAYDSALTLKSVATGSAFATLNFTQPGDLTANPVNLLWDGQDADTTNGAIAVLTFTVSETAEAGAYPVTVTYLADDVFGANYANVAVAITDGEVTVEKPVEIKNGLYFENGAYYYYVDGKLARPGLILLDGYYYYIKSDCTAVTNITRTVDENHTNGLLPPGEYTFGEDGKMIVVLKNGVFYEDGAYYYYYEDERTAAGLVEVDGDYYFIQEDCTAILNTTVAITSANSNGLLPAGSYTFGEDGKMVTVKNGIFLENGTLYYYVNNARKHAGLIKIGDDYYYAKTGGVIDTNTTRNIDINHTNGLLPVGSYQIGADGKLIVIKNGIFYENGTYYYYQNDAKKHAGLFLYYDGYYYYAKTGGVLVTNETRYVDAQHSNGYPYGNYTFGADGKAAVKHGIEAEDGGYYYYVNGKRVHAGLIKLGDYYYYVRTGGEVVTSIKRVVDDRHSNGYQAGTYIFDAQGRAPEKNGIIYENGAYYYYVHGAMLHAGLVSVDGDYYYIKSDCSAATNTTRYVDVNHNNGLLPAGNYTFGPDGKMQPPKNGVYFEDGVYYYYVNNAKTHPGLVVFEGHYYYFKSDNTAVVSTTRSIDERHANGLLPAGTYTFNEYAQIVDTNGDPLVAE